MTMPRAMDIHEFDSGCDYLVQEREIGQERHLVEAAVSGRQRLEQGWATAGVLTNRKNDQKARNP